MDQNDAPRPDTGPSMRAGFGWAWATAVGSVVLAGLIGFALGQARLGSGGRGDIAFVAGAIPPVALLGLLAISWFGGYRQMARGVLAAFGSMFAVLLLGVAACFGIFSISGF
jgi:hypothetical protein